MRRWKNSVCGKTKYMVLMSLSYFVFYSFVTLLEKEVTAKDHFHPMMKLLPEGSNYFQDANCPRSTD